MAISRENMALRAAAELVPGQVLHLGHGLPGLVADHLPPDWGVIVHTEPGLLGFRPWTSGSGSPPDLNPGGAVMDCAHSAGVIRGGHLDVAILEALQVSEEGDLVEPSSIAVPWTPLTCSGETAAFAERSIAMLELADAGTRAAILPQCTLPVSARRCIDTVVSDIGLFRITPGGLMLSEIAPGWILEQVRQKVAASFEVSSDLKEMTFTIPSLKSASKVYPTATEAVADISDGAIVMIDGFGGPGGMAHALILALRDRGAKELTIVSNSAGIARASGFGTPAGFLAIDHSVLIENGQVKKVVASFPVSASPSRPTAFELAYKRGEVELELVPQGTLAERIRAGGFGIAAFYTPTGAGMTIAEGRPTRLVDGREQVLERGIRADFALLRTHKADQLGNLVYQGTSRNFNAVMAPAARVTVVEVDEVVAPGELDPEAIVTPGVFVQRIVQRPAGFIPYERDG